MNFEIFDSRCSTYTVEEIALIHSRAYSRNHFTSRFPLSKLIEYNHRLIDSSDLTVLAVENGKVVGFIIAGNNLSAGVSEFVKHNRLWLAFRLAMMPKFLTSKISDRIRSWFVPSRASLAAFRLLSIAVAPEAQSKGIGLDMIGFF
jgi:ribosomal protein S18 acetylase RimI-like enzyme